ncbi:MAG: S-layer homology domain-containing protein [Bacillota bacterium]|nr:S-layer homology domain-containing protein [Bacillota bacterium]
MKKVMSLILATMLGFGTVTAQAAIEFKEGDIINFFKNSSSVPAEVNKTVPTDIEVKNVDDTAYEDGPITVRKRNSEDFPVFDFRATMYMDTVKSTFRGYMLLGKSMIDSEIQKAVDEEVDKNVQAAIDTYKANSGGTEPDAATVEGWRTEAKAAAEKYVADNNIKESLYAELDNVPVYGQFKVKVKYPLGIEIPADMINGTNLYGFNTEYANLIFSESAPREHNVYSDYQELVVTVDIVGTEGDGRPGYIKAKALEDNIDNYLHDLTLTCLNVETGEYEQYTLKGEVSGYTIIGGTKVAGSGEIGGINDRISLVNYSAVQYKDSDPYKDSETNNLAATVKITPKTSGGSSSSSNVTVNFDTGTGSDTVIPTITKDGKVVVNIDAIVVKDRPGYIFDGWYLDKSFTKKAVGEIELTKSTTLYAKWVNTVVPEALDASNPHKAYVIGYPDGDIKPENNITREEIATIFYRLLKKDVRDKLLTDKNDFTDVETDRWSNKAISSMAKGGYIQGYEDGTFGPERPITRAEFVTIVARFNSGIGLTADKSNFSDTKGHWADKYIAIATANNWVLGYEDNTFKPDQYITRAEAMTIINKMLVRYVNEEGLSKNAKQWSDNKENAWYYYQVLEATNSHGYERAETQYNEKWTSINDNDILKDKSKYEDPNK